MTQKAAILALVDEHERALRHLLNMMNNWMDESLNVPVGEKEQKTVKDVLVHLLRSIYTSYFGWMQEKLGVSSFVQSPDESLLLNIEELAGWKQALHDCIDYVEQATAEIVDDDLGKAYPAAWNNNESYMIEQMFEHAIVHV